MSDYFDLGCHSRPINSVPQAQTWFDRGLNWIYGYNHEEAISCFEKAIQADPDCAMANWGIAYSAGPNYNKPWEIFTEAEKAPALQQAHRALKEGLAIESADPLARALLEALVSRYPTDPEIEDYQPYSEEFAVAMKPIYEANPDDLDIAYFYVESLMNRTPWKLWDFRDGVPNQEASTSEVVEILEHAFDSDPKSWDHPGLLHLYIHAMEMSPHPERALRHGDRLQDLVPDAGHLVHMATHIDVQCGDYLSTLERNLAAADVDRKFKAYAGPSNFYAVYRIHNIHFAMYAAMFLAQKSVAISAFQRMRDEVPDEIAAAYPDNFEIFVSAAPHVLIRFGMWTEILELDQPADPELFSATNALFHYAKAIAYANLGRHEEAKAEADAFHGAYANVPDSRMLFNNKARDVIAVAEEMMKGEVAFKAGHRSEGLDHLRKAVVLDDNLAYQEPWSWPMPTRHALGALLMEAGEYEEAESAYRADLGLDNRLPRANQHRGNVWALHGLYECLRRRDDTVELPHIKNLLDQALARADVPIHASCACRTVRSDLEFDS